MKIKKTIKKIGKKAAIGTTMTWIVATLIIAFILIIFIILTLMARSYLGEIELEKKGNIKGEFAAAETLMAILKKEVFINGKKQTIFDTIKKSLDIYFDSTDGIHNLLWYVYEEGGTFKELNVNIANFRDLKGTPIVKRFYKNNKELNKIILENLNKKCEEMQVPQGYITKEGIKHYRLQFSHKNEEYTPWISIRFPYRNKIFVVKYRKLKKC